METTELVRSRLQSQQQALDAAIEILHNASSIHSVTTGGSVAPPAAQQCSWCIMCHQSLDKLKAQVATLEEEMGRAYSENIALKAEVATLHSLQSRHEKADRMDTSTPTTAEQDLDAEIGYCRRQQLLDMKPYLKKDTLRLLISVASALHEAMEDDSAKQKEHNLLQNFAAIDTDGSGDISIDELRASMQRTHQNKKKPMVTDEEVMTKFAAMDVNDDGRISKTEYVQFHDKIDRTKNELIAQLDDAFDQLLEGKDAAYLSNDQKYKRSICAVVDFKLNQIGALITPVYLKTQAELDRHGGQLPGGQVLIKAAEKGHVGVVQALLAAGASHAAENSEGKNILHLALAGSRIPIVCQECEDAESAHYCVDCSLVMCDGCTKHHRKIKKSKYHVLQTVSTLKKKRKQDLNLQNKRDGAAAALGMHWV